MFRYVAVVWDVLSPAQSELARHLGARLQAISSDWHNVLAAPGLSVFCAGCRAGSSQHCTLADQSGVIVGTVFARTEEPRESAGSSAMTQLGKPETEGILASEGRQLVSSYWGQYVAFLLHAAANTCWVIKDPTGSLPCFQTTCDGLFVFFSCMSDCLQMRLRRFTLNWPYIRRRVAVCTGGAHETALEEVSALCGGERLEIHCGKLASTLLWKPHLIAQCSAVEDPIVAAQLMRRTAAVCTSDWLSGHSQILHRLSGGLDSAIVLGCLQSACKERKVTCVTYYRPGGNADERPWARLAARHACCEHIEHARDPCLDFRKLSRMAPLPRPPDDLSFLELTDVERELAMDKGATAIFSGDGGDTVLGSHSAAYAAEEFLRRHGISSPLWSIAAAIGLQTNTSIWGVLGDALRHTYLRRRQDELAGLREARMLVRGDVYALAATERQARRHPWFEAHGMRSSLAELLCFSQGAASFYNPLQPADRPGAELVCPLLSQPFVEICLRIPSYIHFEGGRDRGLARRAFIGAVPSEILMRHWKDRAPGFMEEILLQGRAFAREMLLGGVLVQERLLDARLVEGALSGLRSKSAVHVGEILDHLVTEAWLRTWVGSQAHSGHATSVS